MRFGYVSKLMAALAGASVMAAPAWAAYPQDGHFGMQPPATEIMEQVSSFHTFLVWIITAITLFVLGLLVWVIFRYNKNANPVPKKFSHNTLVEVVWTAVPALILIVIAVFSFPLLFLQENFPDVDEAQVVNIKAQGNQWNWTYYYLDAVDEDGFPLEYVSNPLHRGLPDDPRDQGLRNLSVDYPMVVPVDTVIRVYTSASDVIHSWTVPAFGVKTDAIPGRLNEMWFQVNDTGTYYGQCSELCGKDHAFMPIEVHVVTAEQYNQWLTTARDDIDAATSLLAQFETDNATQLALVD